MFFSSFSYELHGWGSRLSIWVLRACSTPFLRKKKKRARNNNERVLYPLGVRPSDYLYAYWMARKCDSFRRELKQLSYSAGELAIGSARSRQF